ncbi:MAG: CvpA family protein [Proteobacteria bacterium]|nr:CvpA family protein [Pseudomonadota bacterium]
MDGGSELGMLDIIVFAIVAFSSMFGMWRGFIASVLSLLSWFLSIYLTYKLYPIALGLFVGSGKATLAITAFTYTGLFIVTLIALSIANTILMTITGPLRAGFIDSILGFIFGFLKSSVIVFCLYTALIAGANIMAGNKVLLDDNGEDLPKWLTTSKTHSIIAASKIFMFSHMSTDMKVDLHEAYVGFTNKGVEDKFIAHTLDEIVKALPVQARTELEIYKEGNSMRQSTSTLQINIASRALEAYDRAVSTGLIQPNSANQTDITKLRNIVSERSSEIKGG